MTIRWWRKSLAAQLIGFTLMALAISQGLTFLISWDEHSKALKAAMKSEFFSRSASVTRLMESIPEDLQNQTLSASETNNSRFWITSDEPGAVSVWRNRAADELSRPLENFIDLTRKYGLGKSPKPLDIDFSPIRIAHADEGWSTPAQFLWNLPQPAKYLFFGDTGYGLAVQLDDGRWLNSAFYKPSAGGWWTSKSLTSLGLTASILALIAVVVASRIARPLRNLATSAEALGRGENLPPLGEEGPDEIRRTAEAFNRMQGRIHRFIDDRTRMLAAIGHDLRTPLTSLRLRAEFVRDVEVQQKMLSTIDELQSMTEAAIAFARGEATAEETRAIELGALVGSICDDHADLGHPVSFVDDVKLTYRCRPDSLRRAIRNLIENAVRYGGEARVFIRRTPTLIEIVVEDRGPGIPEGMEDKVFAPFFRVEASRNRDTGGIGLGLSIARAAVRQHGGDILLVRFSSGMQAVISLPMEGCVNEIVRLPKSWIFKSAVKGARLTPSASARSQAETS